MTQLINGNEVCDRCDKPYIPALNGVSCDCPSVEAVKKPVQAGMNDSVKLRNLAKIPGMIELIGTMGVQVLNDIADRIEGIKP